MKTAGTDKQLPDSCDVVIIGAGLGGLTAAALLAKAGLDVCVCEASSRPGGCCAGFERNGFRFDTAIHWLNQCGPSGLVRRIFDFLSPDSPATPANTRIRRFITGNTDFLLTNNPDEMMNALIENDGGGERAVRAFFKAARATANSFFALTSVSCSHQLMPLAQKIKFLAAANMSSWPLIRYSFFSADKGLRTLFNCSGLRTVFCTEEHLLSCLMPVGWAYGNDFQLPPAGGSRAFILWLCGLLDKWNATVALNTRVTNVRVENGKAAGVSCIRDGQEHDISAKYVIAACDTDTLFTRLLPRGVMSRAFIRKQRTSDVYTSCATLSIGLDCPVSRLGLNEEAVLLRRADITRKEHGCDDPEKTEISVIASSFRDPSLAASGKGTMTIYAPCSIGFGNYWGSQRDANNGFIRGKEYRSFKNRYADALVKRVEQRLVPNLRDHIEFMDIATPLTYLRYTGNRDGAIMGFRPTFANVIRRIARYKTPIKNLLVGGQWAELGGGVPMAVRAGMNSALFVLKDMAPEMFFSLRELAMGEIIKPIVKSDVL